MIIPLVIKDFKLIFQKMIVTVEGHTTSEESLL